jgi:hypothetical protein
MYHQFYPTQEKARCCVDAKHFYVVSSGASLVDPGIIVAIAGSGNDILIGDYHEAADDKTLDNFEKSVLHPWHFSKPVSMPDS